MTLSSACTVTVLVSCLALGCAPAPEHGVTQDNREETRKTDDDTDLKIEFSHDGNFNPPTSTFTTSIDASGIADIKIFKFSGVVVNQRSVENELPIIHLAVQESDFFSLPEQVGILTHDLGFRKITIASGDRTKSVVIGQVRDEMDRTDPQTHRAIKLWGVLRGCIDDPDVIDSRPNDLKILSEKIRQR